MACDTLRTEAEQALVALELTAAARNAATDRTNQAAAQQSAANEALAAANAELAAATASEAEAQQAVADAAADADAKTDAYFACVVGGMPSVPGQLPSFAGR